MIDAIAVALSIFVIFAMLAGYLFMTLYVGMSVILGVMLPFGLLERKGIDKGPSPKGKEQLPVATPTAA